MWKNPRWRWTDAIPTGKKTDGLGEAKALPILGSLAATTQMTKDDEVVSIWNVGGWLTGQTVWKSHISIHFRSTRMNGSVYVFSFKEIQFSWWMYSKRCPLRRRLLQCCSATQLPWQQKAIHLIKQLAWITSSILTSTDYIYFFQSSNFIMPDPKQAMYIKWKLQTKKGGHSWTFRFGCLGLMKLPMPPVPPPEWLPSTGKETFPSWYSNWHWYDWIWWCLDF